MKYNKKMSRYKFNKKKSSSMHGENLCRKNRNNIPVLDGDRDLYSFLRKNNVLRTRITQIQFMILPVLLNMML